MKKIFVFACIMVLVIGISFSSAQDNRKRQNAYDSGDGPDANDRDVEDRVQDQDMQRDDVSVRELMKKYPGLEIRRKEIIERARFARNRYLETRNKLKETIDSEIASANELRSLKSRLNEACAENEGDDCNDLREQAKTALKTRLLRFADKLIYHLEILKDRVANNENLEQEEAKEIISNINNKIAEINAIKNRIDRTNAQTSKEEFVKINDALKELASDIKKSLMRHHNKNALARLEHVIAKLNAIGERINNAIGSREKDDSVASNLERLFENYKGHVKLAEESLSKSKRAWNNNDHEGARLLFREAVMEVKSAKEIMKEILMIFGNGNQRVDLDVTGVSTETVTDESNVENGIASTQAEDRA